MNDEETSEVYAGASPKSLLSKREKVQKELESSINLKFSYAFTRVESGEVKKHLSLLRRKNNEVHPVNEELISAASKIRQGMELYVVESFLNYARQVGVLPDEKSVFPDRLPDNSDEGLNEFFRQSYREDGWISPELWKPRWLCTMSNSLRQVQIRGNPWVKDRLTIAKDEVTYTYHLDPARKDHFITADGLTTDAMIDTFPSIDNIWLAEETNRKLITHATQGEGNEIINSGFIAPYRHIRPLSLSEGVVSLPYSEHIYVFDPDILKQAGFSLMRYDENRIDYEEISEVLEPLPVPVFLASGVYDTEYFKPEEARQKAHIWSLNEPSAGFGQIQLEEIQNRLNEAQGILR